jgi:hypothetical protein
MNKYIYVYSATNDKMQKPRDTKNIEEHRDMRVPKVLRVPESARLVLLTKDEYRIMNAE